MTAEQATMVLGRHAAIDPSSRSGRIAQFLGGLRVVDLSHAFFPGMPGAPSHPPYVFTLVRRHGDTPRADGVCTANEVVMFSGHTGTHLDALGHASQHGKLHGGLDAGSVQTGGAGLTQLGIETVVPVVSRGVLLDIAALHGLEHLPAGCAVTSADLAAAERRADLVVAAGDAVLIRTGWARLWSNGEQFRGEAHGAPGPDLSAANWLVERGVRMTGSDTAAYEVVRPGHNARPVHARLLVEAGVYIAEALNLEELAQLGSPEFVFVASPLKLVGATGSPIRPLALCLPRGGSHAWPSAPAAADLLGA